MPVVPRFLSPPFPPPFAVGSVLDFRSLYFTWTLCTLFQVSVSVVKTVPSFLFHVPGNVFLISGMLVFSFLLLALFGKICACCLDLSDAGLQPPAPELIVDVESMDIFPVGWCEANSYPLTTPRKTVGKYRPVWTAGTCSLGE